MDSGGGSAQTTPAGETDEELILQFQQGAERAFNLLVGRYKDPLMNFVYRFLGDYDEADDVVQETFVRLWRSKHTYRPVAKFSTWLYTIAANLARTQLSRRRRHAFFSLSRPRGEEGAPAEIPDTRYAADAAAESSLTSGLIEDALKKLPPKYREVVILCDIQELSYEEICRVTGANIGTVKSRLSRGRTRLQELLKDIARG
jgi:RNA polymerase sigma-70 factor (ECF subfamily)